MKKQVKKLKLAKETVRGLSVSELTFAGAVATNETSCCTSSGTTCAMSLNNCGTYQSRATCGSAYC